jgi:hypothetical protein
MDRDLSGERIKLRHRLDWERNHIKLTHAYLDIVKETKTVPTLKELKEKTGISFNIISKHLREMDLDRLTTASSHKLLANNIIMGLASKGASGDPFAAKLYFQIMFGFSEKSAVDHTSKGKEIQSPIFNVIDDKTKAICERIVAGEGRESIQTEPVPDET